MPHAFDDPSVLFQTARGTVLRCACCDRLEVQFGNIALAEDPTIFKRFCEVALALDLQSPAQPASDRPVVLPVDGDKLNFRFTRDEAAELQELVRGAVAMLELEGLLDETLNAHDNPPHDPS
jgi:hypothetical protein